MKKLTVSLFILITSLFVSAAPASAKVILQEKGNVNIASTETIDDDLFISTENVTLDGNVQGSVFVGAGSVTINGDVAGDVVVGAGNVTISGSSIGGNVIIGAGQLTIDDTSTIGGSLLAGVGMIKNDAKVGRNAFVAAGSADFDNLVGKELRFAGRELTLGSNAKIGGDLVYALGENEGTFSQDPQATISGQVRRITPPTQPDITQAKSAMQRFGHAVGQGFLVISFLGSLLIGMILLKLFPKSVLSHVNFLTNNFWSSFGAGLVIVLVFVPLLILLAISVVGIPLAGLLIPLFFIGTHLAKLLASYALGLFIAKRFSWKKLSTYAIYAVGLLIFYILRAIPVVGWLISILFTWVGLGTLWNYTKSNLKNL